MDKRCITCKFEPKWNRSIVSPKIKSGFCNKAAFKDIILHDNGDITQYGIIKETKLEDCNMWESK